MQLSPHFWLDEFVVSETADLRSIDNSPTSLHLQHLRILAMAMEQVRALFNTVVHVTSGYRSKELNRAVGGVVTSAHALGWACDFHVAGLSDFNVARAISRSTLVWDQLIWEPGRCVHFSVDPRARRDVLTQPGGPGTAVHVGIVL